MLRGRHSAAEQVAPAWASGPAWGVHKTGPVCSNLTSRSLPQLDTSYALPRPGPSLSPSLSLSSCSRSHPPAHRHHHHRHPPYPPHPPTPHYEDGCGRVPVRQLQVQLQLQGRMFGMKPSESEGDWADCGGCRRRMASTTNSPAVVGSCEEGVEVEWRVAPRPRSAAAEGGGGPPVATGGVCLGRCPRHRVWVEAVY